jgi:hypothetical protein
MEQRLHWMAVDVFLRNTLCRAFVMSVLMLSHGAGASRFVELALVLKVQGQLPSEYSYLSFSI